jgi:hypothetical protein
MAPRGIGQCIIHATLLSSSIQGTEGAQLMLIGRDMLNSACFTAADLTDTSFFLLPPTKNFQHLVCVFILFYILPRSTFLIFRMTLHPTSTVIVDPMSRSGLILDNSVVWSVCSTVSSANSRPFIRPIDRRCTSELELSTDAVRHTTN